MSNYKHTATAHVQLTVEVDVGSNWGGDCTVAQVHKQAEEEASNHLYRVFRESKDPGNFRIVGKPKVTAVLATREGY